LAWQNELLDNSEDMMFWKYVDPSFAHLLDPNFMGYPSTKTVTHQDSGTSFDMPVAPSNRWSRTTTVS
jgi:hypothetical protein